MSTGYGWEGIRQVCARHVPERLWGGSVYTWGAKPLSLPLPLTSDSNWCCAYIIYDSNREDNFSILASVFFCVCDVCCVNVVSGLINMHIQCESNPPPEDLWQFFQNGCEFFNQILRAYYAFLSTLDYEFLFSYLQLWRSYVILSVTTQCTSCVQNVHHRPKRTLAFSDIFPKQLGIFSPNFTRLLSVHTYARLQIFIQLSPTLTKLCHIKCDHQARVSVDGGHFEHIMVVVLNMA